MLDTMELQQLISRQRAWAEANRMAADVGLRADALDRLHNAVRNNRTVLEAALYADLGKSAAEAYMTEIGLTLAATRYMLKNIRRFSRQKRVSAPLSNFPARNIIYREPYGVVLIMVPWNYPVLLALEPLAGAVAAGNTVLLKFSPYAEHTAQALTRLVAEVFPQEHVAVIDSTADSFLEYQYDYIFFTGSPATGRTVMSAAAKHLTPLTLELGGKSPCIVHKTADIRLAARRIVFGKFVNCGQTCVAPDYILADETVKPQLIEALADEIKRQYSTDPLQNTAYGRIINRLHFDRLMSLADNDKVVYGGKSDAGRLQIEPTVLDGVTADDAIMQQEIFGPLLPVISYKDFNSAVEFVKSRPKPLALYLFADDKDVEEHVLTGISFGGGCVNDTIMHLASPALPFGGVGMSGMGNYHGRYSFDTFSRMKGVVCKPTLPDLPFRYQPYNKLKQRIVRFFLH